MKRKFFLLTLLSLLLAVIANAKVDGIYYNFSGISSAGTPDVDFDYQETFYSKPRYPALDIAYLAVQE